MRLFQFLRALLSDSWAIATSVLSIVSVVAGVRGKIPVPVWIPWALAYGFLCVAAFRLWNKEYREPGPQVYLNYDFVAVPGTQLSGTVKNRPFVLEERSKKEDAFNVTVMAIERCNGTASFSTIPRISGGENVSLLPKIDYHPPGSILFTHDFELFLNSEWHTRRDFAPYSTTIPVVIRYENAHGQGFETCQRIEYNHLRGSAKTYRVTYGRFYPNAFSSAIRFIKRKLLRQT